MLSKSLIQFSVGGRGCVPSLLFDLRSNYGGGDGDKQHPWHTQLHSVVPTPQQATANLRLCWRLLYTHEQVWVSLFCGHCSFLLDPSMHRVLFVPCKNLFPQSCVSSGGSMWVNCDLLQEGLCHTQVFCTQSPCPCSRPLLTHTSSGDTQTLRGRSCSVTAKSQKVLFEPSEHLWWVWGLILTVISPLLPYCLGFSFALGCEAYFFGGLQHSPVHSCPAVSCFPSPRIPRVL